MKTDKLTDAIGMVDEKLIARADKKNIRVKRIVKWTAPIAAMLAITISLGAFFWNAPGDLVLDAYALTEVEYPQISGLSSNYGPEYNNWKKEQAQRMELYGGKGDNLDVFFQKTIQEFLTADPNENALFSPLNVYMALAVLAETSTGETRRELLDLLNAQSITELRKQAHSIWNANYQNGDALINIMANSVWMNDSINYNQSILDTLATNYYAQSFRGTLGSKNYVNAQRQWLKDQTGGMLDEITDADQLQSGNVLSLASAMYFKARWEDEFYEQSNTTDYFYTDSVYFLTTFMNKSFFSYLYCGENFSAVRLDFFAGGVMYFILPNEAVSTATLKSDPEFLSFLTANEWENKEYYKINFSIPKFDIRKTNDLKAGLKNLGVEGCFKYSSDFSPMVKNSFPVRVADISQNVRLKIDEKGVEAATYTKTDLETIGSLQSPKKTIDFVLDRPFIFCVKNQDDLPLFAGTINDPSVKNSPSSSVDDAKKQQFLQINIYHLRKL